MVPSFESSLWIYIVCLLKDTSHPPFPVAFETGLGQKQDLLDSYADRQIVADYEDARHRGSAHIRS